MLQGEAYIGGISSRMLGQVGEGGEQQQLGVQPIMVVYFEGEVHRWVQAGGVQG